MKLATLALLSVMLFPGGAVADETSKNAIRAKVEEVVRQRHPTDTEQWWRALGPEAPEVIIGLYKATGDTYQKIRLLQGLRAFPDDSMAVTFLIDEAAGTKKSVIRNAAVQALGASQGEKALEELNDYLKHPDPQTRFAAAKALDRIGTEKTRAALDEYLGGEKVPWIGERIKAERPPEPVAPPAGVQSLGAGDWVGEWKGHWIEPGPAPKEELKSTPALLKVTNNDPSPAPGAAVSSIIGELVVSDPGAAAPRKFQVQPGPVAAKGRWAGRIVKIGKVGEKVPSYAFDATLEKQAGRWVILFRVPDLSMNAVLGRR